MACAAASDGTAAAVAARFFPDASGAYYASGGRYADALGGGADAAKRGWPLLLTAKDSLSPATPKVGTQRIVLGGPAAVSDMVRDQLAARRVAGKDRFSTAAATARDAFPGATVGYLATGLNFPDALAGAPAAARDNGPLLLASKDCVTVATRYTFTDLGITSRVILGGTGAVTDRAANLTVWSPEQCDLTTASSTALKTAVGRCPGDGGVLRALPGSSGAISGMSGCFKMG